MKTRAGVSAVAVVEYDPLLDKSYAATRLGGSVVDFLAWKKMGGAAERVRVHQAAPREVALVLIERDDLYGHLDMTDMAVDLALIEYGMTNATVEEAH